MRVAGSAIAVQKQGHFLIRQWYLLLLLLLLLVCRRLECFPVHALPLFSLI